MVFSVSKPEENGPCPSQCQLEHRLTAIEYSLKELNMKVDLLSSNVKPRLRKANVTLGWPCIYPLPL